MLSVVAIHYTTMLMLNVSGRLKEKMSTSIAQSVSSLQVKVGKHTLTALAVTLVPTYNSKQPHSGVMKNTHS